MLGRFRLLKSSTRIAVLIVLIVGAWVLSGVFKGEETSDAPQGTEAVEAAKVRIKMLRAEPKERQIILYGVTEPRRMVSLRAETEGRVIEIPATEGDLVKEGDVILRLEERDKKERLNEAKARVKQRQVDYTAAKKLSKQGFRGEIKLAESKADLEAAKARLRQAEIDFEHTVIRAPYDGVLERVNAEIGELVGPNIIGGGDQFSQGAAVATVVENDPYLVVGQVSEKLVKDLKIGLPGKSRLVTGEIVEGTVSFIGKVADSETRTYRVELEVPNPEGDIYAGMTAEINVPVEKTDAHFVPSSALSLNEEGVVGIKAVIPEKGADIKKDGGLRGTVKFFEAKMFEDELEGLWLKELPRHLALITLGQEYVRVGDEVLGVPEKAKRN